MLLALLAFAAVARAGEDEGTLSVPGLLALQAGLIAQQLGPMRSPYEGRNSLPARGEFALTHSYLASLGFGAADGWQAIADLRLQRGRAVNGGNGLAGFANGEFQEAAGDTGVYPLRTYVRRLWAQDAACLPVDKGIDKLASCEPVERIELKAGQMLPSDDFDRNRYMSNPLSQFMNLGLVNNAAWDFAQTSRGTSQGVALGWHRRHWSFVLGSYRMPSAPAGPALDAGFRSRNDNAELVLRSSDDGVVLRLLAFRNRAPMGRYDEALRIAASSGGTPALDATRGPQRIKRGWGMSLEWPLGDDGDSGLFLCAARNDGRTEDFSFTEADANLCAGFQLSGVRWGREGDRLGVGLLVNRISAVHQDYLAAGGTGIQVGDGRLSYGPEQVIDVYYAIRPARHVSISPDLQWIRNPGYNRDRGPALFAGVRVTVSF